MEGLEEIRKQIETDIDRAHRLTTMMELSERELEIKKERNPEDRHAIACLEFTYNYAYSELEEMGVLDSEESPDTNS